MYFRASWFGEYKGPINTLRLRRDPWKCGIGIYEDVDGIRWDVHGLFTGSKGKMIWARRVDDAPSYYSTATDACSGGFHRWIPYTFEVVEAA